MSLFFEFTAINERLILGVLSLSPQRPCLGDFKPLSLVAMGQANASFNINYTFISYLFSMGKLLNSSFFILTIIAILSGIIGAWMSGMWDFLPPDAGIYSFGSYLDGAGFGSILAIIGLIPYWIFHLVVGDAFYSWANLDNKVTRIAWVACWATFLGYFFSRSLAV